jgi:hypothetical protein
MNRSDPTCADVSVFGSIEQELSVDEVAQMDAIDDATAEAVAKEGLAEEEKQPVSPSGTAEARLPSIPMPIIPLKRLVSGRYRSCRMRWELQLRVDVDGRRPMKRISGDFYRVSGATVTYYGSFVVNAPTLAVTSSLVRIEGIGQYTFSAGVPKVRVIIPRHSIFTPPAAAHVQFFTLTGRRGAAYVCPFESRYFRSLQYEQDYVKGVTPFVSYNTGSLPSGGPARTLTVSKSYAEAGIEMQNTAAWNEISLSGAGSDSEWDNAELHQAMEMQFSLWKDKPQWMVWLLAAQKHIYGTGLYGIMFDQEGKQRQGCATFHAGIGGTTAVKQRDQLYCYVHELGHCFNLFHSFHKKYMTPPMPNRPESLSWMNYPGNYAPISGPGGEAAFWSAFPFHFDDLEVIHLRHAFRNNIIIGGNPFGTGAALEDPEAFADSVGDNSGLCLTLEAQKTFALGEPVVVEIRLSTTDTRSKTVHRHLHLNLGFVQMGVRKPGGQVVAYEPLMQHCVEVETTTLDLDNPSIYDSVYLGYGKHGFLFDQVGIYQVRAIYYALDGSQVISDVLTMRVRTPIEKADEDVADLLLGDEQGKLFYLLGSDSEFLASGNKALDEVLEKHGTHRLAVYAQLAKGTNAGREFKSLTSDRRLLARKPDSAQSIMLLSAVVDASEAAAGVDNITLNQTMRCLARAQKSAGDKKAAAATKERLLGIFGKKNLRPHVMRHITAKAEEM